MSSPKKERPVFQSLEEKVKREGVRKLFKNFSDPFNNVIVSSVLFQDFMLVSSKYLEFNEIQIK